MKKSEPATLFLFLINPFLSFILAIRNLTRIQNCIVFVIFCALWGWSMSFEYTPCDNYRIAAMFCSRHFTSLAQVFDYHEEGKSLDMYLNMVNLIVHKFSNNAKAYFAVLSFVYGVFMVACIRYILINRINKKSQYLSLFLILMFFTASIANSTMPRYWTAAWCMTFVMLKLTNKQYQWVPLLVLLPYIHFSFLPVSLVLGFAVFFSGYFYKYEKQLFILMCVIFILSFFLSEGLISYLIPDEWFTGEKATSKYNSYVNTNQLKGRAVYHQVSAYRQANNLVTKLFHNLMKIGSFLVIYFIYKYRILFKDNIRIKKIFIFILMLGSICFFMSIVRNVGWRYIWLLWLPIYYLLFVIYDIYRPKFIRRYSPLLILVNVYTIVFAIYLTYMTVDLRLFWQPLYNIIVNGIDFPPVNFV